MSPLPFSASPTVLRHAHLVFAISRSSVTLFPPIVPETELSPDGSTSFPLVSPPPDVFNPCMWAGGSFIFSASRIQIGAKVKEALSVESVELKKGGELCFVVTKRVIGEIDAAGGGAVEERRTHVYRYRVPEKTGRGECALF